MKVELRAGRRHFGQIPPAERESDDAERYVEGEDPGPRRKRENGAATKIVFTDMARPISAGEKSARLSVLTVTITADPPSPWITRMITNASNEGARPQPMVASVKTSMPPR
jgi:hypothetical protein